MKVFRNKAKWKLKRPLPCEVSLWDLPVKLEAAFLFKYKTHFQEQQSRIECKSWLMYDLTSLNFLKLKSMLNEASDIDHQENDENFESFLEKLNNRRPFSEQSRVAKPVKVL